MPTKFHTVCQNCSADLTANGVLMRVQHNDDTFDVKTSVAECGRLIDVAHFLDEGKVEAFGCAECGERLHKDFLKRDFEDWCVALRLLDNCPDDYDADAQERASEMFPDGLTFHGGVVHLSDSDRPCIRLVWSPTRDGRPIPNSFTHVLVPLDEVDAVAAHMVKLAAKARLAPPETEVK